MILMPICKVKTIFLVPYVSWVLAHVFDQLAPHKNL